ncbi:hypothetical protein EKN06_15460 [Croceicoccus ponticola]|uniref:DUF5681 domain-containing protein n=1 Tax=Croceicoccus ponticola TaxID=2217664 RepID=A0A437GU09_9SPHN|nr:DUF5681 domain-containing protein [Croceicoccus ponticola]RVQ64637.1 hypothetical protein EKN06_15460 [Croceicoccus ponticola]
MMEGQPVGYGKPPTSTQFCKGQSGNPKGRPKNRHTEIPYDGVLGQMVTIREDGRTRRVTAAEAFLLQLTQKGLAGDSAAARSSLEAIEAARAKQTVQDDPLHIIINVVGTGHSIILDTLGFAIKKYPTDKARVRWVLNPWIVEAALSRLGDRQLSKEEQREVWSNTRTPHKVRWPEWWTVRE